MRPSESPDDLNKWDRPENPHLRIEIALHRLDEFGMWTISVIGRNFLKLNDPYHSWANQNCKGLCSLQYEPGNDCYAIYFELERDAVLFKLFFADDLFP